MHKSLKAFSVNAKVALLPFSFGNHNSLKCKCKEQGKKGTPQLKCHKLQRML